MERVAYRPIRGAPEVAALLTSFGVGQALQNATLLTTRLFQQPVQIAFPAPPILSGAITLGALDHLQDQHRQHGRRRHRPCRA